MRPVPDDIKMMITKSNTMNIEELKAYIKYWEEKNDCSHQPQILDVAKKELNLKYQERQEQIELLTQSLTSSSRIGRWISSIKAVLKQFV